ncbi:hypothetical protein GCM10023259_057330 [Thermocatellispora tengchongensis]
MASLAAVTPSRAARSWKARPVSGIFRPAPKNGLEAARKRGRIGGRRPVVDDDKRAAILARRGRGESIRTIAAGVKVSVGVVHKTLADAQGAAAAAEGNHG